MWPPSGGPTSRAVKLSATVKSSAGPLPWTPRSPPSLERATCARGCGTHPPSVPQFATHSLRTDGQHNLVSCQDKFVVERAIGSSTVIRLQQTVGCRHSRTPNPLLTYVSHDNVVYWHSGGASLSVARWLVSPESSFPTCLTMRRSAAMTASSCFSPIPTPPPSATGGRGGAGSAGERLGLAV